MRFFKLPLILACLILAPITSAIALDDLPQPEGEIVLKVTGNVEISNMDDGSAGFDMEMLRSFDPITYKTTTIWSEGEQEFTGVLLKDIYERIGVTGGDIEAHALDDYTVELPFEDAVEDGPILAYEQNGEEISIREKGPIWVIYPFDENPEYQSEVYYARSIWQLVELEVIN